MDARGNVGTGTAFRKNPCASNVNLYDNVDKAPTLKVSGSTRSQLQDRESVIVECVALLWRPGVLVADS